MDTSRPRHPSLDGDDQHIVIAFDHQVTQGLGGTVHFAHARFIDRAIATPPLLLGVDAGQKIYEADPDEAREDDGDEPARAHRKD